MAPLDTRPVAVEVLSQPALSLRTPAHRTPVGVSIDHAGFVWVVDQNGTAFKVDPDTQAIQLTVSGLTGPYTYSDMTGAGLNLVVNPPG